MALHDHGDPIDRRAEPVGRLHCRRGDRVHRVDELGCARPDVHDDLRGIDGEDMSLPIDRADGKVSVKAVTRAPSAHQMGEWMSMCEWPVLDLYERRVFVCG